MFIYAGKRKKNIKKSYIGETIMHHISTHNHMNMCSELWNLCHI